MERQEMIQELITSAVVQSPEALSRVSEEGKKDLIEDYRKYLEGKTDLELQNMLVINCF